MQAVKVILKGLIPDKKSFISSVSHDVLMIQEIRHPNIVNIEELFHDNQNYYIISEFLKHGDIITYLTPENTPLSENKIRRVAYDIMQGLKFLYKKGLNLPMLKP